MANEKKIKHLELIQAVINRMANNSFLIKGWCITIVAVILGLLGKEIDIRLLVLVYFPILMFWILDSYFLQQEKLFRNLFDKVRVQEEKQIDFSMKISSNKNDSWIFVFFSTTLLLFYGIMAGIALFAVSILLNWI